MRSNIVSCAGALIVGGTFLAVADTAGAVPLTNLQLWVRADAGVQTTSGPASPGDPVTAWEDQSAANNDLVTNPRIAATPPTLLANQINGKPALHFDAGTDSLQADEAIVTGSGDYTIFAVVNAAPTGERVFGATYGLGNTSGIEAYVYNFNRVWVYHPGGEWTSGASDVAGDWVIIEVRRAAGTRTISVDGVVEDTIASSANLVGNREWTVGSPADYVANPLGLLAEELVYVGELSESGRQEVYDYLHAKYFEIPEPATLASLAAASGVLLLRRRA